MLLDTSFVIIFLCSFQIVSSQIITDTGLESNHSLETLLSMVPTSESYKILLKLLGSIRQIQDDIKQHLNDNLCYNQLYKVINFDMSSSERWILESR